jgi:2-dehydropantoate 2-reductase
LIGPDTVILPMMNGVPWWFLGEDAPLRSVDADGALGRAFPVPQVLGCVVHASSSSPRPGLVVVKMADRLILGEPSGADTVRVRNLVELMTDAGIPAVRSERIRTDLWYKLWGNMTMNPISALTLASSNRILDDDLVREFAQRIMEEARAIGARCGCAIQQTAADRMVVTRQLGAFRTSMLQDVEAGRSIELDALLAAPREIAARFGIATPNMDALYGMTRLMGASRGVYAAARS